MLIFAASNLKSGMKTAGITSSLFCVHTYGINGITTPSPEPGNRPGVSALKNLTARSVVSLLSNLKSYEHEELFCAREQNGAAVLLPAPGVEQVPQVDGLTGGRVAGMDGGAAGTRLCLAADGADGREVREGQGGDHQPAAHRRAIPYRHLFTATARRERVHPHRANHGTPSVRAAAHHRLQGQRELNNERRITSPTTVCPTKGPCRRGLSAQDGAQALVRKHSAAPIFYEAFQHFLHSHVKSVRKPSVKNCIVY